MRKGEDGAGRQNVREYLRILYPYVALRDRYENARFKTALRLTRTRQVAPSLLLSHLVVVNIDFGGVRLRGGPPVR